MRDDEDHHERLEEEDGGGETEIVTDELLRKIHESTEKLWEFDQGTSREFWKAHEF